MDKTPHPRRSTTPNPATGPDRRAADHEQIERLAHALWEARGCPVGSPDDDWFRAEQEIHRKSQTAASRRPPGLESLRDRQPERSAVRTQ